MRPLHSTRRRPKVSRRHRPERPRLEVLESRCLLSNYTVGPLVQVSQDDPFAGCTADDPSHQFGRLYPDSEMETRVAVDPTDPSHIVGVFQQDRWSTGAARGLVAGVSFDGGQSWQEVVIPGLSACSGGPTLRASDPWLSFDPDGGLYSISLSADATGSARSAVLVNKSADGGLTWSDPTTLIDDNDPNVFNDKETVTADPTDGNYAYAVWDRISPAGRPEMFSRTTDGGLTWEPARPIFNGGGVVDSHILVLPDGTVVDVFSSNASLVLIQSADKGETWGPPVTVARMQGIEVQDPDTGRPVRSAPNGVFDVAVDPNSGSLYAVWEDARFSGRQYDGIAFTMSTDGGLTWSAPAQVNQTPADVPPGDRQAFIATVGVAGDGTVGVSYYDFRFNDPSPGLLTDRWFVPGTPDGSGGIVWGNELQLTDQSFDLETAPDANGLFVGDYQGIDGLGSSFVTFFGQTHDSDPGSIFFREIDPAGGAPGRNPGLSRLATALAAPAANGSGFADNPGVADSPSRVTNPPAATPAAAPLDAIRIERFFSLGTRRGRGLATLGFSDLFGTGDE